MEPKNPRKADFELLSRIGDGLWYAVKKDAYRGTKFLAKAVGHYSPPDYPGQQGRSSDDDLAFHDLMFNLNQGPVIAQIFNHENIVSIAGHIQARSFPAIAGSSADADAAAAAAGAGGLGSTEEQPETQDYIVWDFCDAANLSALMQDQPLLGSDYYLPESLCWHVLTSLIRAVTYLHDGKRQFHDPEAAQRKRGNSDGDGNGDGDGDGEGDEGFSLQGMAWRSVDHDWNPILHRAIEPRNIFFQHPQGLETYGMCKLGNFEHAAVTGHVLIPGDGPARQENLDDPSVALAARKGFRPWRHLREDVDRDPATFDSEASRPYTIADELWSIGSVVLTMMTGQKTLLACALNCCHVTTCAEGGCLQTLAARHGCACPLGGCAHLPAPSSSSAASSARSCAHNAPCVPERPVDPACHEPVVNVDVLLARARYTWRLRTMVKELLNCHPGRRAWVSKVLPQTRRVLEFYRGWKEGTEEGQGYRDMEDDMAARWGAAMEERRRGQGPRGLAERASFF